MLKTDLIHPDAIRRLEALLGQAATVTVAAHTHPDGDAMGSAAALVSFLRENRGTDAVAVLPDTPPASVLPVIPEGTPFLYYDQAPQACLQRIGGSGLIVLLDANGFSRTEALAPALQSARVPKVLIDHHLNPEREQFDLDRKSVV